MPCQPEKRRSYVALTEKISTLVEKVEGMAMHQLGEITAPAGRYPFFMLERPAKTSNKKFVCLSAGIHGNEPGSVEAMLDLIARLAEKPFFLINTR